MSTKALNFLLATLILVLAISVGNAAWRVKAIQTSKAVTAVFTTGAGDNSIDAVIDAFDVQMVQVQKLNKYCLVVFACTPLSHRVAVTMVDAELARARLTREHYKIQAQARQIVADVDSAALQGKLKPADMLAAQAEMDGLKTRFYQTGKDMHSFALILRALAPNAPAGLQPIFNQTF